MTTLKFPIEPMEAIRFPRDIPASDDWGFDNLLGRELATRLINEARDDRSPSRLAYALRSLSEAGSWNAAEVGFAFALAEALL
jgi:hypothetical protein